MRIEDELPEDEYNEMLLAVYKEQSGNDMDCLIDMIKADIAQFESTEKYEACARLLKILKQLE